MWNADRRFGGLCRLPYRRQSAVALPELDEAAGRRGHPVPDAAHRTGWLRVGHRVPVQTALRPPRLPATGARRQLQGLVRAGRPHPPHRPAAPRWQGNLAILAAQPFYHFFFHDRKKRTPRTQCKFDTVVTVALIQLALVCAMFFENPFSISSLCGVICWATYISCIEMSIVNFLRLVICSTYSKLMSH